MASLFPAAFSLQSLPSLSIGSLPTVSHAISAHWSQLSQLSKARHDAPPKAFSRVTPAEPTRINGMLAELPPFMKASALPRTSGILSNYKGSPPSAERILKAGFSGPAIVSSFARSSPSSTASRQFSTLPAFSLQRIRPAPKVSGQQQIRFLGFSGTPSQATLYRAEQHANSNPTNAYAQERFYDLLLRANLPQIIAERYTSGNYAANRGCEDKYSKAVEKLAHVDETLAVDGTSAYAGARGGLSADKIQAIGQGVAARARGASVGAVSVNHGKDASGSTGTKEEPIYVVVDESLGGSIFKWVKFFLYFGLIGYLALVFLSLAVEATTMFRKVGGPANNEAAPSQQTVRFSDVHGCDEAKEELQELVEFLKNPTQFSTLGGKLPKGVLLVGPPGTGKTLLARAVAGEAGVPFFFMSGSEFDEVYVGVGAKRVRELFAQARAKAPAIVFIDELDAIGGKRNERDAAYVKQTLNQLLVDLDGFSQNSGVIFLAATNFPQLLDKALTRPGRFDRNINVPLPDVRGRIAILKHHAKNIQTSPTIDLSLLARGTPGFSGAEIENMVNQAAVRASRMKAPNVRMEDFEWAKDKIMMGAERKSAVIPIKEREMTAYHEGGHTIVGLFTEGHTPVYKVTIMPRGQALGLTHYLPEGDQLSVTKKQYLAKIDSALGGKLAEEMIYGKDNVTGGCSSDLSAATRLARAMVMRLGMSEVLGDIDFSEGYRDLSSGTKELIEKEVKRIIDESRARATAILEQRRTELDRIAKALVEYETLNHEEILQVVRGEKLPDKIKLLPDVPIKLPEGVYSGPTLEGGPGNTGEVRPSGEKDA